MEQQRNRHKNVFENSYGPVAKYPFQEKSKKSDDFYVDSCISFLVFLLSECLLISGAPNLDELRTLLANHVLIDMPNVIITPHIAYNSWEGIRRILDTTSQNITGFIAGSPQNVVT